MATPKGNKKLIKEKKAAIDTVHETYAGRHESKKLKKKKRPSTIDFTQKKSKSVSKVEKIL